VRTVADHTDVLFIVTSTANELSGVPPSMTLNDLEVQNRVVYSSYFSRFQAVTYISRVNCAEITGYKPRQSAYKIFSIKCRFQVRLDPIESSVRVHQIWLPLSKSTISATAE